MQLLRHWFWRFAMSEIYQFQVTSVLNIWYNYNYILININKNIKYKTQRNQFWWKCIYHCRTVIVASYCLNYKGWYSLILYGLTFKPYKHSLPQFTDTVNPTLSVSILLQSNESVDLDLFVSLAPTIVICLLRSMGSLFLSEQSLKFFLNISLDGISKQQSSRDRVWIRQRFRFKGFLDQFLSLCFHQSFSLTGGFLNFICRVQWNWNCCQHVQFLRSLKLVEGDTAGGIYPRWDKSF